jgi:hypothetical protein
MEEVDQKQGGMFRRNDLFFLDDGSPVNRSVSRRHAHVEWNPATSSFEIFHDSNNRASASRLLRGRQWFPVGRLGRGTALCHGDEIYLGRAILRFEEVEPVP